jgi:hypothetical protein
LNSLDYNEAINKQRKKSKSRKSIKNKSIKNTLNLKEKNIHQNVNNMKLKLNDSEINFLDYARALKIDKRTYFQYYLSLLKTKHLFLFSFVPNNDYNSTTIKVSLFFFSFALYYTTNALFYTDKTMHNILTDKKKYNFIYQIPKLIYSNLISTAINTLMYFLCISEKKIIKLKEYYVKTKNLGKKLLELKKELLIKFILYYILYFIFLCFFWFYVTCFCLVYKNTQIYLIKDTLISFSLSMIYPLGYYLIPGIFRILALRSKTKDKEGFYKISKIIQSI